MKFLNLMIAFAFALTACDQKGNSTTTIEPKRPSQPEAEPGVFYKGSTYSTVCLQGSFEVAGIKIPSSRKTYIEEDGRFSKTDLLYVTEKACDDELFSVTETGSLKETAPDEHDLVYETTTVTLKNTLAVSAFNQAQVCGFSDWQIDIAKDISTGTAPCFSGVRPRTEHQAKLLEGTVLYLGENPQKIDKRIGYTK